LCWSYYPCTTICTNADWRMLLDWCDLKQKQPCNQYQPGNDIWGNIRAFTDFSRPSPSQDRLLLQGRVLLGLELYGGLPPLPFFSWYASCD
jgi:hypothetical protein